MSRRRTVKLRIATLLVTAVATLLGSTVTSTSALLSDSESLPGHSITTKATPPAPTGIAVAPSTGYASRVFGSGSAGYTGDGGPPLSAAVEYPWDVVGDKFGNFYVSSQATCVVRQIGTDGTISTYAGTGTCGYNGDGIAATSAQLSSPQWMAVDNLGNLYIGDSGNFRIREVSASTGLISTVAGNGGGGGPGTANGVAATSIAMAGYPAGIGVDAAGNVYFGQTGGHTVRKVDISTGLVSTVAGTGGTSTNGTGDGGPATSATLTTNSPSCVTVAANGDIYICDASAIRKVAASTGIISTVVGTGVAGYSGDGAAATAAQISAPASASIDASGNLYFYDSGNYRIRMVDTSGTITTYVGNGASGVLPPDGTPRTGGGMFTPKGLWADPNGNVYWCDFYGARVFEATKTAPRVTWTSIATYDKIRESTDPTFASPATILGNVPSLRTDRTWYDIVETSGTKYYYRVYSSDTQYLWALTGFISPYSPTVSWQDVSPPPVLTASVTGTSSITANIATVPNATGYYVQRSTSPTMSPATYVINNTTATSAVSSGLTAGTTYYYRAATRNAVGQGPWGPVVSATTVPDVVTNAFAGAPNTTSLKVSWDPPATGSAASYTLDYSTSSSFTTKTTLNGLTSPYTITGLTASTTYYIRIAATLPALNGGGTGAYTTISATTTVPPAPSTPTGLTALPTNGSGYLVASWTAAANDAAYQVYYSTTSTVPAGSPYVQTTATTVTLRNLSDNTTYYVKVVPLNSALVAGTATAIVNGKTTPAMPTPLSGWVTYPAMPGAVGYYIKKSTAGCTTQPSTTTAPLTTSTTYNAGAKVDGFGNPYNTCVFATNNTAAPYYYSSADSIGSLQ